MANEKKKCMYTEGHYTDEDRKVLCDGCEEECEYNQKQEAADEDEKIRESLIDWFGREHAADDFMGIPFDKVVAWLKRQCKPMSRRGGSDIKTPRLFICRDKNLQGYKPGRLRIFIGHQPMLNGQGVWCNHSAAPDDFKVPIPREMFPDIKDGGYMTYDYEYDVDQHEMRNLHYTLSCCKRSMCDVTALDSEAEATRKYKQYETALVRMINRSMGYLQPKIKEG